jgi:hypothetical protein
MLYEACYFISLVTIDIILYNKMPHQHKKVEPDIPNLFYIAYYLKFNLNT